MSRLPEILARHEGDILNEWTAAQVSSGTGRVRESELRQECREFLRLVREAAQSAGVKDPQSAGWADVRQMLSELSRSRSLQGSSPAETAMFVLSLKRPLFGRLRKELARDGESLAEETWTATELLDRLGVYTTEIHQKTREEVINRQQQEMLELSTPVVKLWDGILAIPLIGTLDSARTQVVMENLLETIVATGSEIAIIDITGVPMVDTLTAQHLLKTVTASRLMGAECIISGIRPQIAQTIVHLGVELGTVTTKASLADAFILALQKTGATITRAGARA